MSSHYKQLPLDEVTPGMELSDDLLDSKGQVMLTQGTALTEATIAALRRHQVALVPITFDEEVSPESEEAELAHHEERLARLFRRPANDEDDATGILEQYVRYYRLGARS